MLCLVLLQSAVFFFQVDVEVFPWSHSDHNSRSVIKRQVPGKLNPGVHPPPPEVTCGFLIKLTFCQKPMWFIGVEVVVHPLLKKSWIRHWFKPIMLHYIMYISHFYFCINTYVNFFTFHIWKWWHEVVKTSSNFAFIINFLIEMYIRICYY